MAHPSGIFRPDMNVSWLLVFDLAHELPREPVPVANEYLGQKRLDRGILGDESNVGNCPPFIVQRAPLLELLNDGRSASPVNDVAALARPSESN